MKDALHELMATGALSELDVHFGRFMERLAGPSIPELAAVSALLSRATREGNVCLDIHRTPPPVPVCDPERLLRSEVVGKPGEYKPLVLDARGGFTSTATGNTRGSLQIGSTHAPRKDPKK